MVHFVSSVLFYFIIYAIGERKKIGPLSFEKGKFLNVRRESSLPLREPRKWLFWFTCELTEDEIHLWVGSSPASPGLCGEGADQGCLSIHSLLPAPGQSGCLLPLWESACGERRPSAGSILGAQKVSQSCASLSPGEDNPSSIYAPTWSQAGVSWS